MLVNNCSIDNLFLFEIHIHIIHTEMADVLYPMYLFREQCAGRRIGFLYREKRNRLAALKCYSVKTAVSICDEIE